MLQVGFNRRFAPAFAAARAAIDAGRIGTPQLLRSLTRDPGPVHRRPGPHPAVDDLLRDPDPRLRHAVASSTPARGRSRCTRSPTRSSHPKRARKRPTWTPPSSRSRFDNGAIATAGSQLPSALYGYDVRGEAFGSAGMVTAGHRPHHRHDALRRGRHPRRHRAPRHRPPARGLRGRDQGVRRGRAPPAAASPVPGAAARTALEIALAAIAEASRLTETGGEPCDASPWPPARKCSTSTCRSLDRVKRITERGLTGGDLGLVGPRTSTRWPRAVPRSRR